MSRPVSAFYAWAVDSSADIEVARSPQRVKAAQFCSRWLISKISLGLASDPVCAKTGGADNLKNPASTLERNEPGYYSICPSPAEGQ